MKKNINFKQSFFGQTLLLITFILIGLGEGRAIERIVDTSADTVNSNDGVLSLREAVTEANNSPGTDLITFSSSMTGAVINLVNGPIKIADALIISNPRSTPLTIHNTDNWNGRVFRVDDENYSNSIQVIIEGLTISGGITRDFSLGGGGIFNAEDLTLNNCSVEGNQSIIYQGGGIHNTGIVTLWNTSITDNTAAVGGGGILNYHGTMTLIGCTIQNNYSAAGEGGGIGNFEGTLTIITVSSAGTKSVTTVGEEAYAITAELR